MSKQKKFEITDIQKGWWSQREFSYLVPSADIIGRIPIDLKGTYFRNGPGINEVHGKVLNHPIDGDGMVCALSFNNGLIHVRSKFVLTKSRMEEEKENKFKFAGQMGTRNWKPVQDFIGTVAAVVTGKISHLAFRNPSNTNSFYWGKKLLSCYETCLPVCLDPETLETMGPDDLGGNLHMKAMAAHFRIDSVANRLVCISLRPEVGSLPPCLQILEFNKDWSLHSEEKHHIPGLNYSHDFLLLPDCYIFHKTPFVNSLYSDFLKVSLGWKGFADSMHYHSQLESAFIVIPRGKGPKEIKSIPTEPFHIFHFGTAEQTGNDIVFTAVCLGEKFNMEFTKGIWLSNAFEAPGLLKKIELDLINKKSKCTQLDRASCEFPTTHPFRHGHKGGRYAYLMASDTPGRYLPYTDIVKSDLYGKDRQVWNSDGVVGEPVFAPRLGYKSVSVGDEDDGYLIVQLYRPGKHKTDICILDAKNIAQGPVARIRLKHHIPYSFHGTFTPEVFTSASTLNCKL